ncbi:unnamed protein product [Acanthosepion pharaonis]|uniref:Uncharacterized protein n=1 Tax=Acanthosepion pharaonis TaxID=158019 RepID=A0A812E2G5_ACAPH|nr:unnamed protein product [Sepia pharaonis]
MLTCVLPHQSRLKLDPRQGQVFFVPLPYELGHLPRCSVPLCVLFLFPPSFASFSFPPYSLKTRVLSGLTQSRLDKTNATFSPLSDGHSNSYGKMATEQRTLHKSTDFDEIEEKEWIELPESSPEDKLHNGTGQQLVTMTGTVTRGYQAGHVVEVQLELTQEELRKLTLERKFKDDDAKRQKARRCTWGLRSGLHVVLLGVICVPAAFIFSTAYSFYIGCNTCFFHSFFFFFSFSLLFSFFSSLFFSLLFSSLFFSLLFSSFLFSSFLFSSFLFFSFSPSLSLFFSLSLSSLFFSFQSTNSIPFYFYKNC